MSKVLPRSGLSPIYESDVIVCRMIFWLYSLRTGPLRRIKSPKFTVGITIPKTPIAALAPDQLKLLMIYEVEKKVW